MKRYRLLTHRILVGVALLAMWQVESWILGTYWLSTPWATISRFFISTCSRRDDAAIRLYPRRIALGALIGGVPAMILPFVLRRTLSWSRSLDPFMVGGYGAPKLALAPLFILWFGIGTESKIALVASIVFFIDYFSTLTGVRSLDARLVQMAQLVGATSGRSRATSSSPARCPTSSPASVSACPCDRRRGHRRAYLVQSRPRLSGAGRRDEFRHDACLSPSSWRRSSCTRSAMASMRPSGAAALAAAGDAVQQHACILIMHRPRSLKSATSASASRTRQGREPSPWVIRDLTFSVGEGEFLTIIGPSGAGKSTLLNMIAQIDVATPARSSSRATRIIATDPKAMKPGLDRRIGYVTQDDNLLPWRTTIDNVLFPLEVQGRLDARAARMPRPW